MKIDSSTASTPTLQQQRLEHDHEIQSVFSQLLTDAGQPQYASAQSLESDQPLESQVQESWDGWYELELQARYHHAENPRQLGQQFGELIQRASQEGAYAQPKAFLSSLSKEELDVVQRIGFLADPIKVNELTEEGALNLLLPSATQIDLNRDGLTQSGAAYGIKFPDSTTPPEVAQAWEEATDGMSLQDRSHYSLQIKLPTLLANIKLDAEGRYSHRIEPGDPNFVNPLAEEDYSYVQATRDQLSYLKAYKSQIDPVRFEEDTSFWSDFQQRLIANRV